MFLAELEVKLNAARRELETSSKTKEEMVQDVALQVKTRMDSMHGEVRSLPVRKVDRRT